ncbi:MAG: hypothetical protein ABIY55_05545, partial [Kofleriaceae bacterium]
MRVRPGATAVVALIAALHGHAVAEPSACADGKGADCKQAVALYLTVATHKPRAQLADFLIGAAQRAAKARNWAKAIPLYQAIVVARGPGSPEAKQLATLWTLAGQNERAAEAWSEYAGAVDDPAERSKAAAEAARLGAVADPFADKLALADQAIVVARGPGSTEAKQLATLWTLAGQNASAAEAWAAYAAATKVDKEREAARAEATRLSATPDPFADKLQLTALAAEAKTAF